MEFLFTGVQGEGQLILTRLNKGPRLLKVLLLLICLIVKVFHHGLGYFRVCLSAVKYSERQK
jgi:hypothetical protein